jgi:hypothetical protein
LTHSVDDRIKKTLTPVSIRIDLGESQSFFKRIEILKENPAHRTSEAEEIEKLKGCAKFEVN